jgi:hypothetical protein
MRRRKAKLSNWTRDIELSSGRVVRAEWHPEIWAVGIEKNTELDVPSGSLLFDKCLTDGELWELGQRADDLTPGGPCVSCRDAAVKATP